MFPSCTGPSLNPEIAWGLEGPAWNQTCEAGKLNFVRTGLGLKKNLCSDSGSSVFSLFLRLLLIVLGRLRAAPASAPAQGGRLSRH